MLMFGVLAPKLIADPAIVGLILPYFDEGVSLLEFSRMAIERGWVRDLSGGGSNEQLVKMAFRNVVGEEPNTEWTDLLLGYMDGRSARFSQAEFLAEVAELDLNQTHIDLVGLAQSGVEYLVG